MLHFALSLALFLQPQQLRGSPLAGEEPAPAAVSSVSPSPSMNRGYHDYSAFEDDTPPSWSIRRAVQIFVAVLLGAVAVPLLGPITGALMLLLVRAPYERLRRAPPRLPHVS